MLETLLWVLIGCTSINGIRNVVGNSSVALSAESREVETKALEMNYVPDVRNFQPWLEIFIRRSQTQPRLLVRH